MTKRKVDLPVKMKGKSVWRNPNCGCCVVYNHIHNHQLKDKSYQKVDWSNSHLENVNE